MEKSVVFFLVCLFLSAPLMGTINPQSQHEISSLEDIQNDVLFSYTGPEWCGEDTSDSEYKVLCPDMPTFFGDNVTTLNHSDHFVLRAVFEDPDYFESLRQDGMELSDQNLEGILSRLEEIWQKFIVELNFSAPYALSQQKYKTNVVITDYGYLSGGTFDDGIPGSPHPHIQVHYEATGGYAGLAHEFTHALQNMAGGGETFEYGGWFSESHAEFMASQVTGDVGCSGTVVNNPHHHYGTTRNRYCNWQFWEFLPQLGFEQK